MQSTMSAITAVVLTAFAAYAGAFFFGYVEGNFALLLMLATVITGLYWVAEKLVFLPQRQRDAQRLQQAQGDRAAALQQQGFGGTDVDM